MKEKEALGLVLATGAGLLAPFGALLATFIPTRQFRMVPLVLGFSVGILVWVSLVTMHPVALRNFEEAAQAHYGENWHESHGYIPRLYTMLSIMGGLLLGVIMDKVVKWMDKEETIPRRPRLNTNGTHTTQKSGYRKGSDDSSSYQSGDSNANNHSVPKVQKQSTTDCNDEDGGELHQSELCVLSNHAIESIESQAKQNGKLSDHSELLSNKQSKNEPQSYGTDQLNTNLLSWIFLFCFVSVNQKKKVCVRVKYMYIKKKRGK
ncbi:hypothetical protein RFI_07346 [Reticulomyxa filosa]|uniref:Zinc/iron permease n=1 Tax=Reticulomyxa filosa TaxID=46433 RepID=X6NWW1_RETFI|nr:hypothetical protein RFI_07346 [Reticulomyxa filosa]|eukprot:ETO29777.1 hypothetical protein RFI_07346 [Reticulomyxa filosa]